MCSPEPWRRLEGNANLKTQVRSRACLTPRRCSVKAKVYKLLSLTVSFPRFLIIPPGTYIQGGRFLNTSKERTPDLSFASRTFLLPAPRCFLPCGTRMALGDPISAQPRASRPWHFCASLQKDGGWISAPHPPLIFATFDCSPWAFWLLSSNLLRKLTPLSILQTRASA